MQSVLQDWVMEQTFMQQSVLLTALRAPDGLRKDHPVKVLMRWYRRCVLLSAFDRAALLDPFTPGGGSFTGPFELDHANAYFGRSWGKGMASKTTETVWNENPWRAMDRMRKVYLQHVDEMPHHFQLHFMHAAQIVGYKHDVPAVRIWWNDFYLMIVNDAHLYPESDEQMSKRLGDVERDWRAREEVTAK